MALTSIIKSFHLVVVVLGAFLLLSLLHTTSYTPFNQTCRNSHSVDILRRPTVTQYYRQIQPDNSVTNKSYYSSDSKIINPPAVLLRLRGGIGNQLFMYACHYAIARKNNWPLYILYPFSDRYISKTRTFRPDGRDFALDHFNIPLHPWNIIDETWEINEDVNVNDSAMLAGDYPQNRVIQQAGYAFCQSETFFASYREEILYYFQMKIGTANDPLVEKWVKKINAVESVAVHVRLGDFVLDKRATPLKFYRDCMSRIVDRLRGTGRKLAFFIFSDEIKYVKQNLNWAQGNSSKETVDVFIVSETDVTTSLQELYLISRCKHQIISTSTFGWWAAYLNPHQEKLVYASHDLKSFLERLNPVNQSSSPVRRYLYYPTGWNAIEPFWDDTQ